MKSGAGRFAKVSPMDSKRGVERANFIYLEPVLEFCSCCAAFGMHERHFGKICLCQFFSLYTKRELVLISSTFTFGAFIVTQSV